MIYSSEGAKDPMNTMEYFWVSEIPNHSNDSGIQLMDGNGLSREMIGSNTAMKNRDDPKKMPKGMATMLDTIKPTITRRVDARVCTISWPLSIIFIARERIFDGAGINRGSMNPSRQKSSQAVMNINKEIMLIANVFAVLSIFMVSSQWQEGPNGPS